MEHPNPNSEEEFPSTPTNPTSMLSNEDDDGDDHNNFDISLSNSNDFCYTYTPYKTETDDGDEMEYNEEDLKNLAESLAPRVTSLLSSNEAALENLLSSTRDLEGSRSGYDIGRIGAGGASVDGNEEDDIQNELNRLGDAERLLRDELEMSNVGFDFMRYAYAEESETESEDNHDRDDDDDDDVDVVGDNDGRIINDATKEEQDNVIMGGAFPRGVANNDFDYSTGQHDDHDAIYDDSDSGSEGEGEQRQRDLVNEAKEVERRNPTVQDVNVSTDTDAANLLNPLPFQVGTKTGNNIADKGSATIASTHSSPTIASIPPAVVRRSIAADGPAAALPPPQRKTAKTTNTGVSSPRKEGYTLYDHAKTIGLRFDNADLGYPSCPLLPAKEAERILDVPTFRTSFDVDGNANGFGLDGSVSDIGDEDSSMGDLANPPSQRSNDPMDDETRKSAIHDIMQCTREYVKPMTSASLSRIFIGLADERKNYYKNTKLKRREREVQEDEGRETPLDEWGVSITDIHGTSVSGPRELLPVRTVTIQIRPDVLVGAVMDAVYTSINTLDGEVTKRQGGHLRALIPGKWIKESDYLPFRETQQTNDGMSNLFGSPMMQPMTAGAMNGMVFQPSLVIDVQLCTRKKSRFAERILLVRCFSISDGQILDNGAAVCPSKKGPPHASLEDTRNSSFTDLSETSRDKPNHILREASSLFQRMRTVATLGGKIEFDLRDLVDGTSEVENRSMVVRRTKESSYMRKLLISPLKIFSPSPPRRRVRVQNTPNRKRQQALNVRFDSPEEVLTRMHNAQKLATAKLLSDFTETPSIMDQYYDIDPIAALSRVDWPYIQSSSSFLADCLNELDNRDLGYSTLASCAFGTFPALMSLDVHYCSQMRDICKENMIAALLKSAQELEIYAREAEYGCAKLIQILEPTLLSYDEKLPEPPEAIPLTSYPLNFTAHEVRSPPWGQKVIEALNLIAANKNDIEEKMRTLSVQSPSPIARADGKPDTEFSKARTAVHMVLAAFQKQEDEELSARVGRKNCQVMDRLAKMQAYKRESIMTIRGSYGINTLATKAADKFHNFAKEYCQMDFDETGNAANMDSQIKMTILPASDQVPLLSCRVIHGGSPGMCYLSYHELLLVTQSIPLVGGNYLNLVLLNDIELEIRSKGNKSRLNPMPSVIMVKRKDDKKELFSFRPSTGAHLFKDFVEIIQDIATESPDAVNFSSQGGLLNMLNEKSAAEDAALTQNVEEC